MFNLKKTVSIFLLGTLITSCGEANDDNLQKKYFEELYVNRSDFSIKVDVFNSRFEHIAKKKTYQLLINDTLSIKHEQYMSPEIYEPGIVPIIRADSVFIFYGDKKAYFSLHSIDKVPFDVTRIENYVLEKDGNLSRYTYTFTNQDYENAEDCNGSCE